MMHKGVVPVLFSWKGEKEEVGGDDVSGLRGTENELTDKGELVVLLLALVYSGPQRDMHYTVTLLGVGEGNKQQQSLTNGVNRKVF